MSIEPQALPEGDALSADFASNSQPQESDPALPRMSDAGGYLAPEAPEDFAQTGVDRSILRDLALKLGHTIPQFTTDWAAQQLCLPLQLVEEILWSLKEDKLVEVLGQLGPFSYRYSVTDRGRQYAARLIEISAYVGPAPVSLESYAAMLRWQSSQRPQIEFQAVTKAISPLVLNEDAVHVAALAASSGRSLFLFGPAGNGKTSLGKLLHQVVTGDLWIPHCLVTSSGAIIRLFDRQCHLPFGGETKPTTSIRIDQRWIRIHRPFVVAGGEMTIAELDLAYSPSLRFYEAPPHLKANGGTFMIDDFGRQRIEPHDLLNRWIIPLEHRIDHFTLNTGQKIQLPFELMLVVATNLTVSEVADPAFLRRMGYRLHLDKPTPENYRQIFQRYARQFNLDVSDELLAQILARYTAEGRELRSSEPRDLVERARDICKLRGVPLQLTTQVLDLAWTGYFGNQ